MNIYLIPYNWSRHVVVSLFLGAAALLTWWINLVLVVVVGPWMHASGMWWSQGFEGGLFVASLAGTVAAGSLLAEGMIRRRRLRWQIFYVGLAGGLAFFGTVIFISLYGLIVPYLGSERVRPLLEDPSLVTLRYRIIVWAWAGVLSGVGPFLARRAQAWLARRGYGVDGYEPRRPPTWPEFGLDAFHHFGGGLAASMVGASVWHTLGHYDVIAGDLYLSAALGPLAWGMLHGGLVWAIPDNLYAGWVRVLSAERFGRRIPLNHVDDSEAERFLGHFPRGLDIFLPSTRGVAELHTSFVVDSESRYTVRGLSVVPTVVSRFLEKIDLRYDQRRPAPLETELKMEDRIRIGPGGETEVEFLLLPKEEQ
ncbi:MAG: hypothetical protein ACI8PZ_000407 [Myxococcota bacterium]